MRKLLLHIIGKAALVPFVCLNPLILMSNLSSCDDSSLRIQAPTDSNFVGYVDNTHSGYVTIGKFSYSGSSTNIKDISINHTFKQGFTSFEPSISDLDLANKTFSVVLKIQNGYEGKTGGSIHFSSNKYKIEFESKPFVIEIRHRVTIKLPQTSLDSSVILDTKSQSLTVNIHGFTSNGINDFNNVGVSSTFNDEIVTFNTSIHPLDTNKFDVIMQLSNVTKVQDFSGHLIFEQDFSGSKEIVLETPDFKLSVLPERSIIQPKYVKQDLVLDGNSGNLTLDGFQYSDIDEPEYLGVSINFPSTPFPGTWSVSITNWNTFFKTFSIKIDFTNATFLEQPVEFNISFTYPESIAYSIETYSIQFFVPIPEDDLEIQMNEETNLIELVGFSDTVENNFNIVVIPNWVQSISLNIKSRDMLSSGEIYLKFSKSGNLVNIDRGCFSGCAGLVGTLFFPSTLLSVGAKPFDSTSFNVLDFTDYDTIPIWLGHGPIFAGMISGGYVLVPYDTPIDDWKRALAIDDLDLRRWEIIQV